MNRPKLWMWEERKKIKEEKKKNWYKANICAKHNGTSLKKGIPRRNTEVEIKNKGCRKKWNETRRNSTSEDPIQKR